MDMILLYIDNCEPALNGVLELVAKHIHQPEYVRVLWVREFVREKASDILRKHGDGEQARHLQREARKKHDPDYWREVYKHYHQKYLELTQTS